MQPSLNQPPMSGDETTPAPGATLPPLSTELPARDAEATPPISETPPKDKAEAGRILLPKALVDDLYREARKNFALIPDMTFALAAGSRALRDIWEHEDGKFIRKDRPFANYVPPKDGGSGTTLTRAKADTETPPVAAARTRWDEAKREGDPDRMTRAANDLLRAAEVEQMATTQAGSKHRAWDERFVLEAGVPLGASGAVTAPLKSSIEVPEIDHAMLTSDESDSEQLVPVAYVTGDGVLTNAAIAKPGERHWTPIQRTNADAILTSLTPVGAAIQRYGTPEQKAAWRQIQKFSLQPTRTETGGASEYADGVFSVDLNQVGAKQDPRDPSKVLPPDPDYVNFMIAHEVFHATRSNQAAMREAHRMQGGRWQRSAPTIGSPQWSVEVRHDKMVYDFLLRAGLLPSPPPPIQRIAPYYAEHLKHPEVPVHTFRVPGYDQPIDAP